MKSIRCKRARAVVIIFFFSEIGKVVEFRTVGEVMAVQHYLLIIGNIVAVVSVIKKYLSAIVFRSVDKMIKIIIVI